MMAAKRSSPLGVVLGGFVQGRRGGRRGVGQEAVILGVPFRAGAAHIVQVRPVGAARFARSVPQLAENLRQITPHETLHWPCGGSSVRIATDQSRVRWNPMVNPYS